MGSTAIKGMKGKPMIDLTFITKNFLPSPPSGFFTDMEALGWKYWGPSPHAMNKYKDQWFMRDSPPDEVKEGNLGTVIHFCTAEEDGQINKFMNMAEYCSEVPDAHKRYSDIKTVGEYHPDGRKRSIMEYSLHKMAVVMQL